MRIIVLGGHGAAGRAVVEALAPHNVRAVSRRDGVDAFTGAGLQQSFAGADVVIDLFTRLTLSSRRARAIHQTEAENVSSAAQQAGVRHVVVLSIIGVDRNPHNYYAGKLQQEQVYEASGVPLTILRAAQFHEFAAQVLDRTSLGPVGLTFQARIQPVAVQEVGRRLAAIATGPPQGRAAGLAGPQPESLAEMMRRYAAATGRRGLLIPSAMPIPQFRGMRAGLNLPGPDAQLGAQTFDQWLEGIRNRQP